MLWGHVSRNCVTYCEKMRGIGILFVGWLVERVPARIKA